MNVQDGVLRDKFIRWLRLLPHRLTLGETPEKILDDVGILTEGAQELARLAVLQGTATAVKEGFFEGVPVLALTAFSQHLGVLLQEEYRRVVEGPQPATAPTASSETPGIFFYAVTPEA